MSQYHTIISGATGVTDNATLELIEDCMRHDIFHSTLDWQTKAQLERAARQAHSVVKAIRTSKHLRT